MKSIGIIRKIHGFITKNTLHTLYYSLIYPHLNYCNIVWASTYPTNLQKIFITQKKFVRLATSSNYLSPSAPLFKKLNLLSIYDINILQSCIFIYKYIHLPHLLPESFMYFFTINSQIHSHNTRHAIKLHTPFCRTSQCQFSFTYRSSLIWNSYYHLTKTSTSLTNFKFRLKSYIIHQDPKASFCSHS